MKILLGSDFHTEFLQAPSDGKLNKTARYWKDTLPSKEDYDIVVLPGDLGSALNGINLFRNEIIPEGKDIIFMPGNHCFYNHDYSVLQPTFEFGTKKGVHFLCPDTLNFDGIKFIGCTLWSKGYLPGDNQYVTEQQVQQCISDFRLIKYGKTDRFSVKIMQSINQREVDFLDRELDSAQGPVVVITHFLPSQQCIMPKYKGNFLNGYFTNDLDALIDKHKPGTWIYGHDHSRSDFVHNNGVTRMVSNCVGYRNEIPEPFEWKVVEI